MYTPPPYFWLIFVKTLLRKLTKKVVNHPILYPPPMYITFERVIYSYASAIPHTPLFPAAFNCLYLNPLEGSCSCCKTLSCLHTEARMLVRFILFRAMVCFETISANIFLFCGSDKLYICSLNCKHGSDLQWNSDSSRSNSIKHDILDREIELPFFTDLASPSPYKCRTVDINSALYATLYATKKLSKTLDTSTVPIL